MAIATQSRSPRPRKLAGLVREIAHPGDYVVFLGAGNITQWAYALPGRTGAAVGDAQADGRSWRIFDSLASPDSSASPAEMRRA